MAQVIFLLPGVRRHESDAGIAAHHLFHLLRPLRHRVIAHDHAVLAGPRQYLHQCFTAVVASGVLPPLQIGDQLAHEPDTLRMHALHFRERFRQKSRMYVKARHIGVTELFPELQCRVVHFSDSVKRLHLSSVIRIDNGSAENRDPGARKILRHLLRREIEMLAVHSHELTAFSVRMCVKVNDFPFADYFLVKQCCQIGSSFRGSPSFLQVTK